GIGSMWTFSRGTRQAAPAGPPVGKRKGCGHCTGCWRTAIADAAPLDRVEVTRSSLSGVAALELWRQVLAGHVRHNSADLTARQLCLLLEVYLGSPPHTVRGLAQKLGLAKPAVTRAIDRLARLDLVRRRRDEADGR